MYGLRYRFLLINVSSLTFIPQRNSLSANCFLMSSLFTLSSVFWCLCLPFLSVCTCSLLDLFCDGGGDIDFPRFPSKLPRFPGFPSKLPRLARFPKTLPRRSPSPNVGKSNAPSPYETGICLVKNEYNDLFNV